MTLSATNFKACVYEGRIVHFGIHRLHKVLVTQAFVMLCWRKILYTFILHLRPLRALLHIWKKMVKENKGLRGGNIRQNIYTRKTNETTDSGSNNESNNEERATASYGVSSNGSRSSSIVPDRQSHSHVRQVPSPVSKETFKRVIHERRRVLNE